uniref:Uncharacterized protein n=1 Tax=Nelumbo nucifera TaxID=4432 RepID=A0A822XV49_NELNU|nr:TPA_asm: hypothetical protein HUJ06_025680 [Nelumbo nucifera]
MRWLLFLTSPSPTAMCSCPLAAFLMCFPTSTPATVQTAATTLYSLLVIDEYRLIIGAKRDIIFALVDIIWNSNSPARSMKDALKALFGILLYPLNRVTMVELGAVPALFSLVVKDGRIGVIEDATTIQLRGPDPMTNFATLPKAKQEIQVLISSEYDSFYCYLCYCDIEK